MVRDAAGSHRGARLVDYATASASLAQRTDRQLRELVDAAPVLGSGIGGTAVRLDIDGVPVFVKRVPLTDLDRRPENHMSTANLFQLPTFLQYGVGSAGFGAWRELAAHLMTTDWVRKGLSESFPLIYHWRVLDAPPPGQSGSGYRVDVERMVAYWAGSEAVRQRLEAVARSTATVALFLEFLPQNLRDWLAIQAATGDGALESASAMVEHCLRTEVHGMNSRGLWHFDAHFRNILTDGRRLYFADLGLATSPRFDLSGAERRFLAQNASHDRGHTVMELVNWLVPATGGPADPAGRNEFIRRCAPGRVPGGIPAWAAATLTRHAPVAVVMNDFYRRLHLESRTTPFPAEELRRAFRPPPGWGHT